LVGWGSAPNSTGGAAQRSYRPSNWISGGPISKGREGKGREKGKKRKKGERGGRKWGGGLRHGFWVDGRP